MKAPTAAFLLASVLAAPLAAESVRGVDLDSSAPSSAAQERNSVKDFLGESVARNHSDLLAVTDELSRKNCRFEDSQTVRCQVGDVRIFVSKDSPITEVYAYRDEDLIMSESSDGDLNRVLQQINGIKEAMSCAIDTKLSSR